MKTFHNPEHTRHVGQHEMFRGKLVACHEVPARLDHVLAELQRQQLIEARDGSFWVNPVNQTRLLLLAESIQAAPSKAVTDSWGVRVDNNGYLTQPTTTP